MFKVESIKNKLVTGVTILGLGGLAAWGAYEFDLVPRDSAAGEQMSKFLGEPASGATSPEDFSGLVLQEVDEYVHNGKRPHLTGKRVNTTQDGIDAVNKARGISTPTAIDNLVGCLALAEQSGIPTNSTVRTDIGDGSFVSGSIPETTAAKALADCRTLLGAERYAHYARLAPVSP